MVCRGAYVGKLSYCAAEWLGAGIPRLATGCGCVFYWQELPGGREYESLKSDAVKEDGIVIYFSVCRTTSF